MPHIATKINCAGDKCGECESIDHRDAFYGEPVLWCLQFHKYMADGHRLPECMYVHLEDFDHPCNKCEYPLLVHWQPATKGER